MKTNGLIRQLRNDFGLTLHQAERYQELFNQAIDDRIEQKSCKNCKYIKGYKERGKL